MGNAYGVGSVGGDVVAADGNAVALCGGQDTGGSRALALLSIRGAAVRSSAGAVVLQGHQHFWGTLRPPKGKSAQLLTTWWLMTGGEGGAGGPLGWPGGLGIAAAPTMATAMMVKMLLNCILKDCLRS